MSVTSPMKMIRLPQAGALVLALLCSMSLSQPAAAQQDGGLFGNLFKPPGTVSDADRVASENVEIVVRMERIEGALRQLTGQVEELQHRNQQLEAQVKLLMETSGGKSAPHAAAAVPQAGGGAAAALPPAVSGRSSGAFDPEANPTAPGAPQPLGSPASSSAGLVPPVAGPGAGDAATVAGGTTARAMYDAGMAQIQQGKHTEAERTFRQLIADHAADRLVPDATFMMGESLFLQQHYSDAAASFLEVSTKFPNSVRAPEALLRLGQSLASMDEKETACATFLEVGRKYPRAPSPIRQAVEREQKRVGC